MSPIDLIDLDSERRILSSMLESTEAIDEAQNQLKHSDFTETLHSKLFTTITELHSREIKPTFIEVLKELDLQKPQDVEQVKHIAEQFIDDGNILYWIGRVKEASKLRRIEDRCKRTLHQLQEPTVQAESLLSELEAGITDIALDIDSHKIYTAKDLADHALSIIGDKYVRFNAGEKKQLDGLPTGFSVLDKETLGYKPGDLILVASPTGKGKTAFALNTCHVGLEKGNILYVNTEMSKNQMAFRWGSILSDFTHERVKTGDLGVKDFEKIMRVFDDFSKRGLYLVDEPNLTPAKLRTYCRTAKLKYDVQVIIVDYVGRMDKTSTTMQEYQVLEQIVKEMKQIAQNLQVAMMGLVQLNDDGTLQGAKRMRNEADLFFKLLPIEPGKFPPEWRTKRDYGLINYYIDIEKNRDGRSGISIPIKFDLARQQITEAF